MRITAKLLMIGLIVSAVATVGYAKGTNEAKGTDEPGAAATTTHLYLDIHRNMHGLTPEGLAQAHKNDLSVQGKYGVKFVDYWYDAKEGTVFCLAEAPSAEAMKAVHLEANGIVADETLQVREGH